MKLDGLLALLDQTDAEFERKDFEELTEIARRDKIILLLVEFIGNKKVEDKINGMVF